MAALRKLEDNVNNGGLFIYNLGSGIGYSVLEMVQAMEEASNRKINYKITSRRPGDIDICYADITKVILRKSIIII